MSVSRLLPLGGANDFNIALTGPYTTVTFTKEYAPGGYSIVSSVADSTIDVYAYNADGSSAGYTGTKSFTATKGFIKMVILGGTSGDLLSFTYKQTFISTNSTGEVTAGPVIESISTSSLPNIDSTTVITGRNFASNIQAVFTSANTAFASTSAKVVTRSSATSLTITRPDNFPTGYSPYTLTLTNPGIPAPVGSSPHILANGITAGAAPVWSTGLTLPTYNRNVAYSQTVTATDADGGSSITYSTVSNGLPTGLSVTGAGNVISGTPTGLGNGSVTIRATDSGGNFVDRTFTVNNVGPNAPVWVTGNSVSMNQNTTFQLSVTTDDALTFTVVSGTLPTGVTMSSSGLLTGTGGTAGSATVTIRATDGNGQFADNSILIIYIGLFTFSSHTFTTAGYARTTPPGLTDVRSAYSATSWANTFLTMDFNGYQKWVAPVGATYRFELAGASGGYGNGASDSSFGGKGRIIRFDWYLNANESITLAVGQYGGYGRNNSNSRSGGGGGASTVFLTSGQVLLGMAGGGGGATNSSGSQSGASAIYANLNGGAAGSTAGGAGGGSWLYSSGQVGGTYGNGVSDGAMIRPSSGGRNGVSFFTWTSAVEYDGYGGFPGGGSAVDNGTGGGGAGYGGGAGSAFGGAGQGGGSYIHPSATNQTDLGLYGTQYDYSLINGYITVTKL